MAGSSYTTTELLASIRRRGSLPSTDESIGSDTNLLALINDELQTYMVELLLSVDEEYLVAVNDQTITAGTAEYSLPARAIARKVRRILSGSGTNFTELSRIEPTYESDGYAGYKWQGDRIVLVPTPGADSTLRIEYFQRPSKVVAASAVATVSSLASATVTTTATVPSTFGATNATSGLPKYDYVLNTPGFRTLAIDQSASASSGTTHVATATPPTLAYGYYITLADETPIPQLPVELHPVLAQRVAFKALESIGDPKAAVAKAIADEMERRAKGVLSPRDEGASRYIRNRYGPGYGSNRRRR